MKYLYPSLKEFKRKYSIVATVIYGKVLKIINTKHCNVEDYKSVLYYLNVIIREESNCKEAYYLRCLTRKIITDKAIGKTKKERNYYKVFEDCRKALDIDPFYEEAQQTMKLLRNSQELHKLFKTNLTA